MPSRKIVRRSLCDGPGGEWSGSLVGTSEGAYEQQRLWSPGGKSNCAVG